MCIIECMHVNLDAAADAIQPPKGAGGGRGGGRVSYCCANDAVPGPLQLVVVGRQELAVAHLQVHHIVP